MQAMINSLQQQTGLSEDKAREVTAHVLEFLKQRLPVSVHQHLDNAAVGYNVSDMYKTLEGRFTGYFGH